MRPATEDRVPADDFRLRLVGALREDVGREYLRVPLGTTAAPDISFNAALRRARGGGTGVRAPGGVTGICLQVRPRTALTSAPGTAHMRAPNNTEPTRTPHGSPQADRCVSRRTPPGPAPARQARRPPHVSCGRRAPAVPSADVSGVVRQRSRHP